MFLLLLACAAPEAAPVAMPPAAPAAPPMWPDAAAPLRLLSGHPVAGTLLLDAGHGAPGNLGNTNWRCEPESDVMRRLADGVAQDLAPVVTVQRTRPDATLVPYRDRLHASRQVDWMVSLHSDIRAGTNIRLNPTTGCYQNDSAPGFAVLWSDEGEADLVARRSALARAVALRMIEAGFLPYPGVDYTGLYDSDATPGVFVDRHEPRKRIMLLRRTSVPAVIVETHQAWDPAEAARWEEPATWAAFAAALGAALADLGTWVP